LVAAWLIRLTLLLPLLLLLLLLSRRHQLRVVALHDACLYRPHLADQQRAAVAEGRRQQLPLPAL
jgi:hypothetical protein